MSYPDEPVFVVENHFYFTISTDRQVKEIHLKQDLQKSSWKIVLHHRRMSNKVISSVFSVYLTFTKNLKDHLQYQILSGTQQQHFTKFKYWVSKISQFFINYIFSEMVKIIFKPMNFICIVSSITVFFFFLLQNSICVHRRRLQGISSVRDLG